MHPQHKLSSSHFNNFIQEEIRILIEKKRGMK